MRKGEKERREKEERRRERSCDVRLDNLLLINVTSLQNVLTQITAAVRQNAADIQVRERMRKGERKGEKRKEEGRKTVLEDVRFGQPPPHQRHLAAERPHADNCD
jgi:hypothetical protein